MKINKSLDLDLNIISPQRNIQIHEGDVDSIDIVLAVSADDVPLDLTGLTIKYDATINNYLAEQDADGAADDDKIVIPVTENMTAMPGLLLIDIRMIQGDEILFTRTIRATVERAVVNGSTYIDFSKITINQRLNALEEQMTYVEELVDGLDTSKQITSNRRPPQTAPATVDVDFFRVGDTWIFQDDIGDNDDVVYKLVEAEYNHRLYPMDVVVHEFTWQPQNGHVVHSTSEPPQSKTYSPIEYVIGELTFSTTPVPEYFKGDTYARYTNPIDTGNVRTIYTLINVAETGINFSTGEREYRFTWKSVAADKMSLIPTNPTAEEIAAMSTGQFYYDAVNHVGKIYPYNIGSNRSFYDTRYIDENFRKTYKVQFRPPAKISREQITFFKEGERWIYTFYVDVHAQQNTYTLCGISLNPISDEVSLLWVKDHASLHSSVYPEQVQTVDYTAQGIPIGTLPCVSSYEKGDLYVGFDYETGNPTYIEVCTGVEIEENPPGESIEGTYYVPSFASAITVQSIDRFLIFKEDTANKSNNFSMNTTPIVEEDELFPTVGRMKAYINSNYYNTNQIDSMIGNIETALSEV